MEVFADLHIHIGASSNGRPIKITGSRSLNFQNIVHESVKRKGLQVVGIVDCMSPLVQEDILDFLSNNEAYELEKGGIIYNNAICILLRS